MANFLNIPDNTEGNLFNLTQLSVENRQTDNSNSLPSFCYQHFAYSLSDPVLFFQSIGDPLSGTDIICVDFNPAARKYFEPGAHSLYGRSLKQIPMSEPLSAVSGLLLQALLTGETRRYTGPDIKSGSLLTAIPLSENTVVLHIDFYKKQDDEKKVLVWDEHVQSSFNRLLDSISDATQSMQVQSELMLVMVMELTRSHYGTVSYLDPMTGDMKGHSISDGFMKGYSIYGADTSVIFPSTIQGDIPGLTGKALEYGKPFFVNRPDENDLFHDIGVLPVDNFLFVPILHNEDRIGFIALADSSSDFTQEKMDAVLRLVRLYSIGLQRWQYEHGLAERKAKYQALLDTAPVMILIIDSAGKIIDSNPFAMKYLGYPKEQLLRANLIDFIHRDDILRLQAKFLDVTSTSDAISCECKLLGNGGKILDVIVNISARRSPDIKMDTITVVCQDISVQKENADALEVSEEKFRMISEQSYMGIVVVQNRQIIFANDAFAKMCEYSRDELIMWDDFEYAKMIEPDSLEEVDPHLSGQPAAVEQYRSCSMKVKTFSGKYKWFEVVSKQIVYRGNTAHLLSILDISERVKAEMQLRVSLKEKEVLLKEIHHRVKNNLQVISSLLNLQSQHIGDKRLNMMFKESQHRIKAMALIHEKLYASDNLVDISFPDYLRALAFFLVRSYQVSMRELNLVIEIDEISLGIDFAVPCGIILNELLSNSLKYAFPETFKGEKKIQVLLKINDSGMISFTVSDNGIGLPEKVRVQKVSSLGLELVKILAEGQLEGSVTLDCTHGTRFCISFQKPGT
ncbi:MAG: PAS domain S-box protein [Spirochaetales bacterium]|nr:PAS domain S-box protein [Spirochaetales bacterium]